ncbi:unnamed protein product [Discosporangium mesarthrocarpum]
MRLLPVRFIAGAGISFHLLRLCFGFGSPSLYQPALTSTFPFLPHHSRPSRETACFGVDVIDETGGNSQQTDVNFRAGEPGDKVLIMKTLTGMLMNPLSVDTENFIVAEEKGDVVGFGQVRPVGGGNFELASLHVEEAHRGQGIGTALARRLLAAFEDKANRADLYLLTLAGTTKFYNKIGFVEVEAKDTPATLRAELAVGSFIQSFFGTSVVCMRAVPGGGV